MVRPCLNPWRNERMNGAGKAIQKYSPAQLLLMLLRTCHIHARIGQNISPSRPTKGPLERTNSFTIFHRRFLPSATLGCEKKQLCGSRHTIEEAMGDKQLSTKGRMKEVTIFIDKSKRKKTFRHPYVLRPRYVYIQTDASILIKL